MRLIRGGTRAMTEATPPGHSQIPRSTRATEGLRRGTISSGRRVTWRGFPKRAWFKRETYTYRDPNTGERVQSLPAKWHAGVDIIQTRTPHHTGEDTYDRVEMHVRAMCGYVYTFEFFLAATKYGRAQYRDSIKGDGLRCKKCDAELAKEPEKRLMNDWPVPATRPSDDIAHPNEELWWPPQTASE